MSRRRTATPKRLRPRPRADRMIADVAVRLGKQHWTIKADIVRGWIGFEPRADGSLAPTVDEAAIAASLAKVAKQVRLEPVSATYLRNGRGTIVGVAAAKDGRQLDAAATAASIAAALGGRAQGAAREPAPITAVTAPIAPKVSTADAMKKGPLMVRLGTWKTWFPVNDHNFFGANIWLPAKIIDGTVLQPGERFDWWSAIDPVTTARGFGPGGFIAGDHTEPTGALGGGMCSSSTTLFNAALRAGLQMGSRSNHKYYIYRYPLGLDATVSKTAGGGEPDDVVHERHEDARSSSGRSATARPARAGSATRSGASPTAGRRASASRPSATCRRRSPTRSTCRRCKPGVREQTEYPADRMDVSVTRVVRDRAGRVLHRDTYRSHYVLWNGVIEVGQSAWIHAAHSTPTSINRLAFSATVHCLTGCAIGEILGLVIATALGWADLPSVVLAIVLAFMFGYALTIRPLVADGMPLRQAGRLAVASDTFRSRPWRSSTP